MTSERRHWSATVTSSGALLLWETAGVELTTLATGCSRTWVRWRDVTGAATTCGTGHELREFCRQFTVYNVTKPSVVMESAVDTDSSGVLQECCIADQISTQLRATQLSVDLRGWFCHTSSELAHLVLRVGFAFLQRFSRRVYLNQLVKHSKQLSGVLAIHP